MEPVQKAPSRISILASGIPRSLSKNGSEQEFDCLLNRRVFNLKESLEKLWDYRYEGAMLAEMLVKHLEGILNYCRTKVRFGVVEALNGNIRMLINRGRGYKNVRYLLLKAKRMVVTNAEFLELQQIRKAA
jgi:transposase